MHVLSSVTVCPFVTLFSSMTLQTQIRGESSSEDRERERWDHVPGLSSHQAQVDMACLTSHLVNFHFYFFILTQVNIYEI